MRIGFARDLLKPLFVAILLPITLAACSSIAGAPPRVIGVTQSNALANRYPMDRALETFDAIPSNPANGLTQRQFRDQVVAIYLNAIDANYYDWRGRVSGERRELGLGLDLVLLGFTNYASVAGPSIVNDLSAAAAGFAGARGALDRNVYFDRALPGLLAAMDEQRLEVRAQIVTNLRTKSAADYPLTTAFGDLSAYEMAGSLDRAIEEVTAQASEGRQQARLRYENAVRACDGEEDVADRTATIMGLVVRLQRSGTPESLSALGSLATLMQLDNSGDAAALRRRIRDALIASYCTNRGLDELIERIRSQSWGSSING